MPIVLITDPTYEISDADDELNTVKFTYWYQDRRTWLPTDDLSVDHDRIFIEEFGPNFQLDYGPKLPHQYTQEDAPVCDPVDIKPWTKSGEIQCWRNCIPLWYNFYQGTRKMKLLDSHQIRQVHDVCIFEINGMEVCL